ncbi:gamma-glutamylcyclotransferase family protein [Brevibacillus reuszeri]|uniref:gamma-glutamylcyclotransferase family protein n=1 Tax=Brevibacillus reuszeri TaxID=54915 RepID=UPI003D1C9503
MKESVPIFVYGSLLKGFWNYEHYILPYDPRIVPAQIKGELYHLPPGYPGLLAGTNDIRGEIVYFSPQTYEKALAGLDELEDFYGTGEARNEYERIILPARLLDAIEKEERVYVYRYVDELYIKQSGIRLKDGDWRKYMQERQAE